MNQSEEDALKALVDKMAQESGYGGIGMDTMYGEFAFDVARAAVAAERARCAEKQYNDAADRAEAAEQERDSAVSWNHRVSVCEKHTAEIVDGPCVICELEAAERKAEEAARDAGRYRWLRGNPCLPFGVTRYRSEPVEYYAGDSLDASIDAAIRRGS